MVKPIAFAAAFVAMLLCCMAVVAPDPGRDWFAGLSPGQALTLDRLGVDELAAIKLRHVRDSPPLDMVLLGNSRILPVGAGDLGIEADRFFNLALTGESLRSSVAVLEQLDAMGRRPKVAVISFDHAEIQYYSNPQWPPLLRRWRLMAADLGAGIARPDIGLADLARMMRRHLLGEGQIFARALAFERVWRGARLVWNRITGAHGRAAFMAADGYRGDGSRPLPAGFTPFTGTERLPIPNRNVLAGYLGHDLDRLAVLAAAGTRIVIVETVLAPGLHQGAMERPSPPAAEARAALMAQCAERRLECHVAPATYDPKDLPWQDAVHPPAAVLAELIRSALAGKGAAP